MNDLLEFDCGFVTNVHTKTIGGREYVVAEAIILREGVLPGSDGPLFYPQHEISKRVGIWNGYPIVAPHPYIWVNGEMKHVSANHSAEVSEQFTVGTVRNDRMATDKDGKPVRKVDLYFDTERADRVDGSIIPAVRSGLQVNVSTGIFTDKKDAISNSEYNGTRYTHTVHNIVPDHLAVLMNEKGACSVFDGCGINVNSKDVLSGWSLDEINAVVTYNRDWPKAKRDKAPKEDFAGPHESFPIATQEDVNSAAKLTGHADKPEEVKNKIRAIAQRKGLKIPDSWVVKNEEVGVEEETPSVVNGEDVVSNSWTQAARQASLASRRLTHDTLDKHKSGKSTTKVPSGHLAQLIKHSNQAVAHDINGDSKGAKASHDSASKLHSSLAKKATLDGDHRTASAHHDAATAHSHAASLHGKRTTRNKGVTYPEVCSKCKGKVDPGVGKCVGCGYELKPISNVKGVKMEEKEQLVSWLVTNCGCWKEDKSETVLNTLTEGQLKQLKLNAQKAQATDIATGIVKKIGAEIGFKGNYNNLPSLVSNAMKKPKPGKKANPMDDGDDDDTVANRLDGLEDDSEIFGSDGTLFTDPAPGLEDFAPVGSKGTKGQNMTKGKLTKGGSELPESGQLGVTNKESVLNALKGLTEDEFLSVAPAGIKQVLNEGKKAAKEKKVAIINQLTQHIGDKKVREQKILLLWKKTIPQLEEIREYAGISNAAPQRTEEETQQNVLANFFGQNGTPPNNGSGDGRPVYNSKNVLKPHLDLNDYDEMEVS